MSGVSVPRLNFKVYRRHVKSSRVCVSWLKFAVARVRTGLENELSICILFKVKNAFARLCVLVPLIQRNHFVSMRPFFLSRWGKNRRNCLTPNQPRSWASMLELPHRILVLYVLCLSHIFPHFVTANLSLHYLALGFSMLPLSWLG